MQSKDMAYIRAIEIMETAITEPTWTETRLGLFDSNGKLVCIVPSSVAYSGIKYLKDVFHLEDRIVEVTVSRDASL